MAFHYQQAVCHAIYEWSEITFHEAIKLVSVHSCLRLAGTRDVDDSPFFTDQAVSRRTAIACCIDLLPRPARFAENG